MQKRLTVGLVLCSLVGSMGIGYVAAESPSAPIVPLTLKGTLLSAKLDRVSLKVVLSELARQADLTVQITEADAQQIVSTTFADLPLQEGIARILEGKSYALITEPTAAEAGKPSGKRVAKIRVLSQGGTYTTLTGQSAAPAAVSVTPSPADDAELAQWKREAVEAPEAAKRIAALQALNNSRYLKGGGLQSVVETALRDTVPEVREMALDMLAGAVPNSQELLTNLSIVAQKDASPVLRKEALMTLVETHDPAATGYLQQALQDPDPQVSATAQEGLKFLEHFRSKPAPQPGKASQQ